MTSFFHSSMRNPVPLRAVFALSLTALSVCASAQTADNCSDVLQSSARNFSQSASASASAVAYKVYNQYCQQDQARSGQSTSIGLDAILDEVPVKFNFGGGSTSERLSNFCKTFDSDYKQNQQWYQNLSLVNDNTTDAWLACKKLAVEGVGFSTAVSQQLLLVSVKQLNSNPVSVQGVNYDGTKSAMTCSAPSSDKSPNKPVKVDETTTRLLNNQFWTITCKRSGITKNGSTLYPPATISVSTSAGPFLFAAPGDQAFDLQYASDIGKRMQAMDAAEAGDKNSIDAIVKRLAASVGDASSSGLVGFGNGGANQQRRDLHCPDGQVVSGLTVVTGGTCHGQCDPDGRALYQVQIACTRRVAP